MQITTEHIIFLLVILSSQCRQTEAFYRSAAMCSSKRITCLSKTSFKFCFQAGSVTYSYGRTKQCPYGTECNEVEGKYTCVKNDNRVPEYQSTPIDYTNLWVTELHGISENDIDGDTNTPWRESVVPVWTEVSTSPSTLPKQSISNTDKSTIPVITDSPTMVPTTVPWTAVEKMNQFLSSMEIHKTMATEELPELETSPPNYTDQKILNRKSSPLTSFLMTEPTLLVNEITTRKIRRKKNPSKPKKKKPTKPVEERKTTVSSSSFQSNIINNSTSSVKKNRPTTPLRESSTTATTVYLNSIKPPKRRRKKPHKTSSTTQLPPTTTKKPPKKLKKRKRPQKTSTTSSVAQETSTSATYLLPTTLLLDSTPETSSVGPTRLSPTTEMSAALIPVAAKFFVVSTTTENPQIPSPSTTIVSLAAPFPCPYYLNKLFSSSTSITTEAAVSLTPPSSCRTAGKYPSKNCHEYFECLKVMWWYRLMIMKCKKGEGFNITLLQCIPDDTCV